MQAIRIIREEHQSLAAVLHGLLYLVREIRAHRTEPDFKLLGAMMYYIDTFPERFHHPKEDAWLFRLLQQRHPPAKELVDRLQSEHRSGSAKLRQLEQALIRYQQGGRAGADHQRDVTQAAAPPANERVLGAHRGRAQAATPRRFFMRLIA